MHKCNRHNLTLKFQNTVLAPSVNTPPKPPGSSLPPLARFYRTVTVYNLPALWAKSRPKSLFKNCMLPFQYLVPNPQCSWGYQGCLLVYQRTRVDVYPEKYYVKFLRPSIWKPTLPQHSSFWSSSRIGARIQKLWPNHKASKVIEPPFLNILFHLLYLRQYRSRHVFA